MEDKRVARGRLQAGSPGYAGVAAGVTVAEAGDGQLRRGLRQADATPLPSVGQTAPCRGGLTEDVDSVSDGEGGRLNCQRGLAWGRCNLSKRATQYFTISKY